MKHIFPDEIQDTPVAGRASHRCGMCGKLAYRSEVDALLALTEIQADPHTRKIPNRVYRNEVEDGGCGWWHLTSKPAKRRHS